MDLQEKYNQIIILMKIGGMTLTEINTLTEKERYFISNYFYQLHKNDEIEFLNQSLKQPKKINYDKLYF